jgi:2-methylcitrate dehydratase PrpD
MMKKKTPIWPWRGDCRQKRKPRIRYVAAQATAIATAMAVNPPLRRWDPASMHYRISAAAAAAADKGIAAARLTRCGPAVVAPSDRHGANPLLEVVAARVIGEEEEKEAAACRP